MKESYFYFILFYYYFFLFFRLEIQIKKYKISYITFNI